MLGRMPLLGSDFSCPPGLEAADAHVDHGEHFLGWHRHKNGWLPPARSTYIDRATTRRRITLHPLSGPDGLSMVVVPCDDIRRPRKVLVVEPAELQRSAWTRLS